jgi:Phosphomannomutase
MITASHNPKEYNGYKLYDETGCQLIPELAQKVIDEIALIDDYLDIEVSECNDSRIEIIDEKVDEAYIDACLNIQLRKNLNKDFTIAFSPEHGTSYIPVCDALKRAGYHVEVVKEQSFPDPAFSNTKSPNPEELAAYEGVKELGKRLMLIYF